MMARRIATEESEIAGLRREFNAIVRRTAIDALQSGNYFDHADYVRAFANGEKACERMIEGLKDIKSRMEAIRASKPRKRR